VAVQAHVFVETPELTKLPPEPPNEALAEGGAIHEIPNQSIYHGPKTRSSAQLLDPVIQSTPSSLNIPSPSLTFEGINNHCGCVPPDTNGSVGPSNYVEIVNTHLQVFNKSTGAAQTAVIAINSLFAGLGDACSATDDGDPVVLYDPLADRWLITQFADVRVGPPFFMSIAISKTPDPTGAYYAYCFQMPNADLNDYPKFGVWPDGYYMTDNQFLGNSFAGAGVFAFDRAKMLVGDPTASYLYFDLNSVDPSLGGVLPSDLDGPPPPIGTPNYFSCIQGTSLGDAQDALRVFQFHADFVNPGSATFTERAESPIAVAAFTAFSPGTPAIPQSGTAQNLDSLADRLMHRLQYRNFASNETLVVNHTVNGGSAQAAVRYYQLRRTLPSGNFGVYDQATFAPDALYRWMGSAALDYLGNMAIGYSVSSTTNFPSIRYAGRLSSDPTNGLFQGEANLQTGAGAQTGASRWGDYSGLSVDPNDDTTFWYTTEYYGTTSSGSWQTRVGRFQIATNSPPAPKGTLQGTVTDISSSLPISNVVVRTTSGFFRVTGASGTYSMAVPPGTYTLIASAPCRGAVTNSGLTVVNGGTTTQNFSLSSSGSPLIGAGGATLTTESCLATNGVIDPGETVTVSFGLQNTGCGNTSNLVATLQATGGVTSPSGPQTYGIVTNNGATVSRAFTFTANGTCGSNITATLQLQTNSANYGTITYTLSLGLPATPVSQNFDGVTAPALPAGWTTSAGGAESPWVTSTTLADTAPNAAFSPDPGAIGSNTLVSPVIPIATSTAKLTFRNNYSLETGFDGGVLEVKIGGGAFQDILTAGGSFAQNGYNMTISTAFGNPLGGRSAWSGSSGGFITTTVNLPATAAGQNIQLQWRCGSDSSVSAGGWYIDTISINDGFSCCVGSSNHPPVVTAASISPVSPTTTNILVVTGISTNDPDGDPISLAYQWQQSTNNIAFTNLIGQTASTLGAAITIAGDYYRVTLTPNDGKTNGAPFTTASVLVPVDADGNGINDDWEVQYFGHIGVNPNADPDGDGFSNLQEFLAGTDPTNSSSALRITSVVATGNNVMINWTTGIGVTDALQAAPGTGGGGYNTNGFTAIFIVTNTLSSSTNFLDVGAATNFPSRYYRVRLVP
jgi:hypothetical protein